MNPVGMRLMIYVCFTFFLINTAQAADDLISLYQQGQKLYEKKDYSAFLKIAEQMKGMAPNHAGVEFQHARALARMNRLNESLTSLKRVAAMGGSPPAHSEEAFASLKSNPEFQWILATFEHNKKPQGRSEVAFMIPGGKDYIPEGIAYDSVDQNFYVGSTYRRKIVRIDSSGKVQDFVREKQDGVWGFVGMEVDPVRRHLWVNTANGGREANMFIIDSEEETVGKTAALKYDLRNGQLLKRYELGTKESPRFLNDVVIAPNGDVYLTESTVGEIYKITTQKDALELIVPAGSMHFPNGLALSPEGNTLYVSHLEGLSAIDVKNGNHQFVKGPAEAHLGNHDGMVFYKNSLVGIQALTGGVDRVTRLHLNNASEVSRVEVLQINHPMFVLPTTGDMNGDQFYYIANSQLRSFDENGKIFSQDKLSDPVILKVDLLESEKEELAALHRQGIEAHLKTDVDLLLKNSPDTFISVNSGKINRISKEDSHKFFTSYFQGAEYSEYEDAEPPIISVSADGKHGWIISRLRIKRTQNGKLIQFVYAGIMTYEKVGDHWERVANVSTFEAVT